MSQELSLFFLILESNYLFITKSTQILKNHPDFSPNSEWLSGKKNWSTHTIKRSSHTQFGSSYSLYSYDAKLPVAT